MEKSDVLWKIYAWGFLMFLIACAFNPAVYGWALYIPLSIGCLQFAHNRPVRYPKVWIVFFYLYLGVFGGPFVMPILNRLPVKIIATSFLKGVVNLIFMSPALYALLQRGYASVRIK